MNTRFILLGLCLWCVGCQSGQTPAEEGTQAADALKAGLWIGEILLKEQTPMPFILEVQQKEGEELPLVYVRNDTERIALGTSFWRGDSLVMPMEIFNTELVVAVQGETLTGQWVKKDYADYRLPFRATYNPSARFEGTPALPTADLTGKWAVQFFTEEGTPEEAVGIFRQEGSRVAGTFLTPLGDYRFLEGIVDGTTLRLSCFDGEHAFLFTATIDDENSLSEGIFWSGRSWKQPWTAQRNEQAALPDPHTLTFLKEGYERFDFTFPDLAGTPVSLSDPYFEGKVVLVQLMGSWCPNCLDETQFLVPFYEARKEQPLAVVALAYERSNDAEKATKRLENLRTKLNISYPILLAGTSNKLQAAETLPMLNHVLAFPTLLVLDKTGAVRKIHTGFSGPGTGAYYEQFTREFTLFVEKLLAE